MIGRHKDRCGLAASPAIFLLFALVLGAGIAACDGGGRKNGLGAEGASLLVGSWDATVMSDGQLVPLNINVARVELGEMSGALHYGEPRHCTVKIEYSGNTKSAYFLSFRYSSGGFCDALVGGYIKVSDVSRTTADFAIKNKADDAVDSGKLKRVSS